MTSIATEISDLELWTKACIVDELTVHLASVTFDVTHHDHVTNNKRNYNQQDFLSAI